MLQHCWNDVEILAKHFHALLDVINSLGNVSPVAEAALWASSAVCMVLLLIVVVLLLVCIHGSKLAVKPS